MEQNPITVVTDILPQYLQQLKNYLGPIGNSLRSNTVIQFSAYEHLHYCCFIVIEDENTPMGCQPANPVLVFEANVDGSTADFLDDFLTKNPEFLQQVYGCCQGFPADRLAWRSYLQAHDLGANAFYIAHPGQTRRVVEYQSTVRQTIESYLDCNRPVLVTLPLDQIKQKIVAHLTAAIPGFMDNPPAPPSFAVKHGKAVLLGIILAALAVVVLLLVIFGLRAAVLMLGLTALYALWLRWRESNDKQDQRIQWNPAYRKELQDMEDRQPQNHLSSITYLKAGRLRLWTLKLILLVTNLAARLSATEGKLSGIVTIHFARWVILPGKTGERARLLFFSNYDGSWENYLGEFVDHASLGLSAIWSNTENGDDRGFPDTQWLGLKGGARNEQLFKIYARNSQRRELIWYSAYPDLAVKYVGNNKEILAGLFSDDQLTAWLKRL